LLELHSNQSKSASLGVVTGAQPVILTVAGMSCTGLGKKKSGESTSISSIDGNCTVYSIDLKSFYINEIQDLQK
jgi:hypothetical protein